MRAGSVRRVGGEFAGRNVRGLGRRTCAIHLRLGADEHADLFRPKTFAKPLRNPRADRLRLRVGVREHPYLRRRAVEDRDRSFPAFHVAVDVGNRAGQQAVGLRADLMRRSVVNAQSERAPLDIDAERLP